MASSRIAKGKSMKRTGSSGKLKDLPPPEPPSERKYKLEDLDMLSTVGTGTFGRVLLVKDKTVKEYMALKILAISDIIRLKQADHVLSEKSILASIKHPFIVNLIWSHHNDTFLYMLLEFVCGENSLLICEAWVEHGRYGGTPEYLAPEIIQSKGHGKAVDWWALGILIFEMLVGYPPFFDDNPFGIYEKILEGKIDWPKHLDADARDLVQRLLVIDRTKRIGCLVNGSEDIKSHDWFKGTDWDAVRKRQLKPPLVPTISHDGDTQNFDKYEDDGWQEAEPASSEILELFRDF